MSEAVPETGMLRRSLAIRPTERPSDLSDFVTVAMAVVVGPNLPANCPRLR
jgi:hypothetical protein